MKVSSLSGNSIESDLYTEHQPVALLLVVKRKLMAILKFVDHIGTAIALGEKGDLEAAHDFRAKELKASIK